MNIENYKTIVEKTAVFPQKVDNFGLAYCWLGLIEESEEAYEAFQRFLADKSEQNRDLLIKEIGDVCWYITAISKELNLSLDNIFNTKIKPEKLLLSKSITAYSGNIKKYYRDNKPINTEELESVLALQIYGMIKLVLGYGIELSEILETNYNKLINRKKNNTIKGDGDNR